MDNDHRTPESDRWGRYWQGLGQRAQYLLDNSEQIPNAPADKAGQFVGLPWFRFVYAGHGFSNTKPYSLTLFHRSNSRLFLRKATWEIWADMETLRESLATAESNAFSVPEPRFAVLDGLIESDRVDAFLQGCVGMRTPIFVLQSSGSITEDAGVFRFEFYTLDSPQASIRLHWSAEVPPELEPAIAIARGLESFLEESLIKYCGLELLKDEESV